MVYRRAGVNKLTRVKFRSGFDSAVEPVVEVFVMFIFGYLSVNVIAQRECVIRLTKVIFASALVVITFPAFVSVAFLVIGYAGPKLV